MADLETRVDKLEGRVSSIEITVEKLSQKVDDFIAESRADRAETKQRLAAMETRMDAMNQRIDDSIASFRNLTLGALFGIGGMSIAVIVAVAFK